MHPEDVLKSLGWYLAYLGAAILTVVLLGTTMAHATVSHKHQNSLGAVIDDLNPYVYLVAAPTQGSVFLCDGKDEVCTNVVLQPYGTDLMHTESLTLCGDESQRFLRGPQVIIYRRVADRFYSGIACHDLYKILQLKQEDSQ